MSTPIDRPLTDDEQNIMRWAAITSIAEQTGCAYEVAGEALGNLAAEGKVFLRATAYDARIVVCGTSIAHMTREDLAAAAIEAAANKEAQ